MKQGDLTLLRYFVEEMTVNIEEAREAEEADDLNHSFRSNGKGSRVNFSIPDEEETKMTPLRLALLFGHSEIATYLLS